jgi:predicted flavoprotein YhiN
LGVVKTDVVVIGGGAAGLFCGITAGKRGRKVIVLEHAQRIGKKIAISGGGRCNFTNLNTSADNFISENPHFCKSALARYTPSNFVSLVEKHGIAYHEKKLGQLFCDGNSGQIIEMLLKEASEAGVEIRTNSLVREVIRSEPPAVAGVIRSEAPAVAARLRSEPPAVAGGPSLKMFEIQTNNGTFISESLVVATGGLSIPPLGASDFGYRLARQFGLTIVEPRPALVPFTLPSDAQRELATLSGISIDATVSCRDKQFRENVLITHRGLSGPAILQISSYWLPGFSIEIDLLPDHDALTLLREQESRELTLANFLSQFLPRRFAAAWCALNFPSLTGTAGVSSASSNSFTRVALESINSKEVAFNESGRDARGPSKRSLSAKRIRQFTPRQLGDIAQKLNHWNITPAGTEGYKKAEVTAGGVSTAELSSQTMEVKSVPGLYFIGEVVDVTGQLGGYNFQWAWASGYATGESV